MGTDMQSISGELADKVGLAPDFFRNAPIIIDLNDIKNSKSEFDFPEFIAILNKYDMTPVGVRGGNKSLNKRAKALNLAILADNSQSAAKNTTQDRQQSEKEVKPGKKPTPSGVTKTTVSNQTNSTKTITQPVRSGQKAYAPSGDLIVLAQVSPGAEVMADGNIHIYGTLRGRALAGVKGNLESRIYCQDLQAELVSVGGHYQISENLEDSTRGMPVQIFLQDETLVIEPI